jgi:hypothetical protein
MKARQQPSAWIQFRDGRVLTFRDQKFAYHTWLSLPRGIGAAFRGKGDKRPVYAWEYAGKP